MANEMLWSNNNGVLTNNKLNKRYRRVAQPMFKLRQFCDVKEAFGKGAGESVIWLQVANLGSYGGQLTETNTFFESTQPLYRQTATVQEYGNSIPWTFKSEALSEFDVEEILKSGLMDDNVKVIEGLVGREFDDTPLKVTAITTASLAVGATNGTASATNTGGITSHHVRKCVLELKKRNVPGFTRLGGGYVGVCSVGAIDGLRGDMTEGYGNAGFLGSETGARVMVNGEVGSLHGVRLVEDSWATMFAYDPTLRTATSKAAYTGTTDALKSYTRQSMWTGASESLDSYFFGAGTVAEVLAVPEEVRKKIPTDYGRSKGLAWYSILDYKLCWDKAAHVTNGLDARIVHFTGR